MIDTLRFSVPVDDSEAGRIEARLDTLTKFPPEGEAYWSKHVGQVEARLGSRINVDLRRFEWISRPAIDQLKIERDRATGACRLDVQHGTRVPETRPCPPRLIIDGSAAKAAAGHNVNIGPGTVREGVDILMQEVGAAFDLDLAGRDLELQRIDWAQTWDTSPEERVAWFRAYRGAGFSRRKLLRYGNEAIMAPSRMASFKLYDKFEEFRKGDLKRICERFPNQAAGLLAVAERTLRGELTCHRRFLAQKFGAGVKPEEISGVQLQQEFDHQLRKLTKESETKMETVRKSEDVFKRLSDLHGSRRASALFKTWLVLSAVGDEQASEQIPERTLRRNRKMLSECGISWFGSDVCITDVEETISGWGPSLIWQNPSGVNLCDDRAVILLAA